MRSGLVTTLLLVAAIPVAAQPPQGGMSHQGKGQGMGMGMGQGMMEGAGILGAVMVFAPDALLKMSDHLGLTAEQTARLTALKEATANAVDAAHQPAMAAHMRLNRALQETPDDTTAIHQYFQAHHTAEGNMQWIRASAAMQARALLTPDQRAMVQSMQKMKM